MSGWPSPRRRGPSLTLGDAGSWLSRRPFVLGPDAVHQHLHLMGTSGSGKSKMLALLFLALFLELGIPCAVIDPHADLVRDCLGQLLDRGFFQRPDAFEQLWYVNFNRKDRVLPFNVLAQPTYDAHSLANQFVEVCRRVWSALADGAAPQFDNIMSSSVLVLVENGLSLTAMQRLLTDTPYREALLAHTSDAQVVDFFHSRFDRWGREAPLMIESTLRRVFLLTFHPALRLPLGQPDNALDFRQLMDGGRSLLVSLGGLDEQTQRFLGSFLTVGFEQAALSRDDIPESARRPYHLAIDEFSLFSATSEEARARVLSLARKYKLTLCLAHQTWSQLSTRLQGAMQNCVEIAFRLGPEDAAWAAPHFAQFDAYRVKHAVADAAAADRSHPIFFSLAEQHQAMMANLVNLRRGEGLRQSRWPARQDPHPAPAARALESGNVGSLEDRYATLLQVPRGVAEQQLAQSMVPAPVRTTVRRTAA